MDAKYLKKYMVIWWLGQINAVMWLYSIGAILTPASPNKHNAVLFIGLFVAALLEHFLYKLIYQPYKDATRKMDK